MTTESMREMERALNQAYRKLSDELKDLPCEKHLKIMEYVNKYALHYMKVQNKRRETLDQKEMEI